MTIKEDGSSDHLSQIVLERQEDLKKVAKKTNSLNLFKIRLINHLLTKFLPLLNAAAIVAGKQMVKFPSNLYLPRLLDYMATEISTSYKNNMAKHFHSYVFRVFNLVTEKKSRAMKIECEDERKLFSSGLTASES
ncbi:hypothetical protein GEMRC1_008693 [Eukaryota sp. GEM-RC1]